MPYFGEGSVAYLYVQKRYDWGIAEYSTYSTITSIASLIGMCIQSNSLLSDLKYNVQLEKPWKIN